jgi:hypothetical protein
MRTGSPPAARPRAAHHSDAIAANQRTPESAVLL